MKTTSKNLTMPDLAQNLRQIRTSQGLTQKEVAQRLGISQQVFSRYEKTGRMSTEMLFLILKALNTHIALTNASAGNSNTPLPLDKNTTKDDIVLKKYQDLSDDD